MTECCLFVCCRPKTHQRLISCVLETCKREDSLDKISVDDASIRQLVEYAASYPRKVPLIIECLDKTFKRALRRISAEEVVAVIEIYRSLAVSLTNHEKSKQLEAHVDSIITRCIRSTQPAVLNPLYLLLSDGVREGIFTQRFSFVGELLDQWEAAVTAGTGEIGIQLTILLKMVISTIPLLHRFHDHLSLHVPIVCSLLIRTMQKYSALPTKHSSTDNIAQSLTITIAPNYPITAENLCNQILQALVSVNLASSLQTVVEMLLDTCVAAQIDIQSPFCIHMLSLIETACHRHNGIFYPVEYALLCHVAGKIIGKSIMQERVSASGAVPCMGAETSLRYARDTLHDLQLALEVVSTTLQRHHNALPLSMTTHMMHIAVHLMAYLVATYPQLHDLDTYQQHQQHQKQTLPRAVSYLQQLPSALPTEHHHAQAVSPHSSDHTIASSADNDNNDDDNDSHTSSPITALVGTGEHPVATADVVRAVQQLYLVARCVGSAATPVCTDFSALLQAALDSVQAAQTQFLPAGSRGRSVLRRQAWCLLADMCAQLTVQQDALHLALGTHAHTHTHSHAASKSGEGWVRNITWQQLLSLCPDICGGESWEESRHWAAMIMIILWLPCRNSNNNNNDVHINSNNHNMHNHMNINQISQLLDLLQRQCMKLSSTSSNTTSSTTSLSQRWWESSLVWVSVLSGLLELYGDDCVAQTLPLILSLISLVEGLDEQLQQHSNNVDNNVDSNDDVNGIMQLRLRRLALSHTVFTYSLYLAGHFQLTTFTNTVLQSSWGQRFLPELQSLGVSCPQVDWEAGYVNIPSSSVASESSVPSSASTVKALLGFTGRDLVRALLTHRRLQERAAELTQVLRTPFHSYLDAQETASTADLTPAHMHSSGRVSNSNLNNNNADTGTDAGGSERGGVARRLDFDSEQVISSGSVSGQSKSKKAASTSGWTAEQGDGWRTASWKESFADHLAALQRADMSAEELVAQVAAVSTRSSDI